MTVIASSAPGKVVLCGEYAVLDGAPAVCMAINRRAMVTVTNIDGDYHRVSAPGNVLPEGRFAADGGWVDWLQGAAHYNIVDAIWRTLEPKGNGALSIELNTLSFVDQGSAKKIGIGSSAALTVALVAALTQSNAVLDVAIRAHSLFQQGVGSGADVATSFYGGLIEYRKKSTTIVPLHWPDGLAYRLIWTGVPASTRTKLEQVEATASQSSRNKLTQAAGTMAKAWHSTSAVLREYPAYIEILRQFSVDHNLGIFDAGHDQFFAEATAAGLVYKPCGAGGGDVGVLLGTSDEQLDDFMAGQVSSGCKVLECKLEPSGVAVEQS